MNKKKIILQGIIGICIGGFFISIGAFLIFFKGRKTDYLILQELQNLSQNITGNFIEITSGDSKKINTNTLTQLLNTHKESNIFDKGMKILSILELINNNFTGAIQNNNGDDTISYFNHAVIYTIKAYMLSLEPHIISTKQALEDIQQAQDYYKKSKLLTTNTTFQQKIIHNQSISEKLEILIHIKVCIETLRYTISSLENIFSQINKIIILLQEEQKILTEKIKNTTNPITNTCLKNHLKNIITTQQNLNTYEITFQQYYKEVKKDLLQKNSRPILCLEHPITPSLEKTITQTQDFLNKLLANHLIIIKGIENPEVIKELCSSSQDSSQIDQTLDSLTEQLNKLLGKTIAQPQKISTGSILSGSTTTETNYINVGDNIEELIDQTQQKSTIRIETIERLKSQPDYNPQQYINQLFKEFYGKDPVFKNPNTSIPESIQ